jgi:hypothetical protein
VSQGALSIAADRDAVGAYRSGCNEDKHRSHQRRCFTLAGGLTPPTVRTEMGK